MSYVKQLEMQNEQLRLQLAASELREEKYKKVCDTFGKCFKIIGTQRINAKMNLEIGNVPRTNEALDSMERYIIMASKYVETAKRSIHDVDPDDICNINVNTSNG